MNLSGNALPLLSRFRSMRQITLDLCKPLTAEDMMVQSSPEASPTKWHLAHTAWFFESFVLTEFLPAYHVFNVEFPWLFNSYYRSFASFPEKRLRASFSRPALEEVLRYRTHVDRAMECLLGLDPPAEALRRIDLGINHEQQHQELLLTDILHAFFTNPLRPPYVLGQADLDLPVAPIPPTFVEFAGGLREIGHQGTSFCYDNELPRHRVWLDAFALANQLVTCGEYAEFIAEGGYLRPELWLSAGWDTVEANNWRAPLYWIQNMEDGKESWTIFTLRGELPLEQVAHLPVSQLSFYEADAYARWAGHRLPTELEWEVAACQSGDCQPEGNLLDSDRLLPAAASKLGANGLAQQFGDCWEWTSSAYLGYPGFKAPEGALGEYNGKFMSGQMVLRGGSCVTPQAHIRASYRNFFAPETRWQFSGIRLAKG